MTNNRTLQQAHGSHPRRRRNFPYCYPVISRCSKGLSIGINLNPDGACYFDCVYCCVDRTRTTAVRDVDLVVVEKELRELVDAARTNIVDEPEFRHWDGSMTLRFRMTENRLHRRIFGGRQ